MVGAEEAHDVAQEAFQKAFVRWRRLSKHDWVGGWVMTTALNLARKSRPRPIPIEEVALTTSASEERTDLVAALHRLPRRQQQALVLTYIGDLPIEAVASVMGVSTGTVKSHLARGRASLRKILAANDV
jgi:RNA polymerase sigma factor (sigma-70 family)